jgi:hypothetical protein
MCFYEMDNLSNLSASQLRKMLDARFPGVYSPSRYIRKAEMVKLLERRNASCLSIPLDIDQCVAGITVPDDWQWIGYENIYLPWF